MPTEGRRSPDSDDPSSGEGFTLGVEAGPDGGMPEEPVASIFDRNIVRRLTVRPEDAALVRELCARGRARRRPELMIDLMDKPIPTAAEEAAEDGEAIAPPEDGEEIEVSIGQSEPRRTPPPVPGEAPGALPA